MARTATTASAIAFSHIEAIARRDRAAAILSLDQFWLTAERQVCLKFGKERLPDPAMLVAAWQ